MPELYVSFFSTAKISGTNRLKTIRRFCIAGKTRLLVLLSVLILPLQPLKAQQAPSISYTTKNYTLTKGVEVSGSQSPVNSGSAIPAFVRGNVLETIGLGEYDADKIAKSGDGNLVSLLVEKGVVEKTNLTTKASQMKLINRDKPWGVVKDSKGNVYWTETGSYEIITNPNQMDETSWVSYGLDVAGAIGIPGKAGSAVNGVNHAREFYSLVSGGDDLVRTISGQEEPPPYILKFSGKIYKLAPNSTTPEVFVSGIQMPTGLAIDKDDNLFVTCFSAKFKVEGGISFSGGSVEVIDDYENTYNSKVVKIAPDKSISNIGAWPGMDYPTSIGVDGQYNLYVMFYTDDFTKVKIAKVQKYPTGQTSGSTYQSATLIIGNSTMYQDMAVDAPGNVYLSDFFSDKIFVLPVGSDPLSALAVFSDKIVAPKALYVDLTSSQLWVKDGKFVNTGSVKKLNLYGYNISPLLPDGLFLTADGKISGTPKEISSSKTYTVSASNLYGFSKDNITIAVNQIAAPNISFPTSTYNFAVSTAITPIPAPNNTGGAFNQQIGPVKSEKVRNGATTNMCFAFDSDGNRYFTQPDSGRIVKVNAAGQSSILLSNLNYPYGVVVDRSNGYLYFSERKANKVKLLYPGFTQPIDLLTVGTPSGMAIDGSGFLYVSNQGSGTIIKYDPKTNTVVDKFVSTLYQPTNISIYNNTLYVFSIDGAIKTIPINTPTSISTLATVPHTYGMTMDDFGNIYLGSFQGVKKIPQGSSTPQAYPLPFATNYVVGIGADLANNLYISAGEYDKQSVYKITPDGYTISPALPDGLVLNANGTISGTPTTITALKDYVVKATNIKGESSATLKIAVINLPTTNIQYATPNTFFRSKAIIALTPVIGGGKPDSYSISPSLPSGLSLNTSTGVISGTPTANQSAATYTVTANNSSGNKSATISITITEEPPAGLQYASSTYNLLRDKPTGNINPSITGGTGLTYSISPSLPAGLTFNTSTGVISGTPTTITSAGTYTVTASNNGGSVQKTISLSVKLDPPSNLTYTFASNSVLRDNSIGTITPAYQGSGATSFSISPALPAGLSFNTTTGVITGTPTVMSAQTTYTVTVTNDVGSSTGTFNLTVRVDPPVNFKYNIAHTELLRNASFQTVTPTYSGSPVTSFSISPALPAGLNLSSTTGTISGTPTALSSLTSYTVTATNDGGSATYAFQLLVTELAPTNLVYSFVNSSLLKDVQITPVTPSYQGSTATSFSISPGLPSGLSLNTSTGVISGTPTAISTSTNYTVTASNSGGSTTAGFSLLVKVDPPTNLRYDFQDNELQKDLTMAQSLPKYSGSPVTNFSISPSLPTGLSFDVTTGKISGKPTSLNLPTSYTVTATNDGGTATTTFTLAIVRIPVPEIAYDPSTFKFTKGVAITTIASPTNTGTVFPQQKIGESLYSGLISPTGVATDLSGNSYVADFDGSAAKIKKLEKGATALTDFVTSGLGSTSPYDLAADVAGNIYMSTGSVIKKISPAKVVSDFVTNLSNAKGLFIDSDNDLYVADHGSGQVIKYEDCNPLLKSVLVTGLNIGATTQVPAENPRDIVVDRQKNIYVLQASSLVGKPTTYFMFLYKYFASDGYVKDTRYRVITSVDNSDYMIIDNRDNLYINTDGTSLIILNSYIDKGKRLYTGLANGKMRGVALDADQNAFYALNHTTSAGLGKAYQFGYSTAGLPAGLQLNTDGSISGTPTTLQSQSIHKVSANSFYGTSTDTLLITVVDPVPQFAYANPNQVLTKGVSSLSMAPVSTGGPILSYSISPTILPNGITFSTSTGTFSGTATKLQDTISTYTVSGTNTGGTSTATVTFGVVDVVPSGLSYASNLVLTVNQPFTGQAATVSGGPVKKYSISPALPMGMYIDTLTSVISGRPTAVQASTNYTVKAENSGGFTTTTISITVNDVAPFITYVPTNEFRFKKGEAITAIPAPTNTGGPIISYSVSGLPAGLVLNANGSISGTPTQLSSKTQYSITANGGTWGNATTNFTIEVYSVAPNEFKYSTPITMVKGSAMQSITPQFTSSGGDAVTKFSVSPDLPAGLTINPATGQISGTPTELQTNPGQLYYIYAENGAGKKHAPVAFILKDTPPAISYNAENVFTKGNSVSISVTSTGGAVTKYAIEPALPDGMAINETTGLISGTPSALKTRTKYTITASNYDNPAATKDIYITVKDIAPVISYSATHNFTRTVAIIPVLPNSTGGAVVQYSISPSLPTGLSINSSTGEISGTPTASISSTNYTITAQNTGGSATATISITVKNATPVISYSSSNVYTKGEAITDLQPASSGGNQITFTVSPSLPSGLTLNSTTGVISGTPTAITTAKNYTITAANDGGTQSATFSITVNDKIPGNISYNATNNFYVDYAITSLSPTVESGGGAIISYSISPALPAGLSLNTTTGVISGTPTVEIPQTNFTVTAQNSGGNKQAVLTIMVVKLSATIGKTDVSCNGGSNGTATVTVIGGKAPYTYSWSPSGGNAVTASGLSAGTYTVTISDDNNTTITRTVTIDEPLALSSTISSTLISQNGGNDGTATVNVGGGTAPYTYSWSPAGGANATATGLTEGTYTVTITDNHSCTLTKTIYVDAPAAAPSGMEVSSGNTKNTLTWTANTEADLASYKVYGGTTANPTALLQTINKPAVTYTHSGLTNGTTYYYRITAVDAAGNESAYSLDKSATPQGPQTITFDALPSKTYGDGDFVAGALASSGLTVNYTSDNESVVTIVAGKIHIVGAGSANITASQAGDNTWLAAADVSRQLTVSKKALTVSASAENKVYDGNHTATVSLSDDRVSGDVLTTAIISATFDNKNVGAGKTVTVSGISISGADANNYAVNTSTTTTADITVKTLTITASAASKTYDGINIATVTLSDNRVNGDVLTATNATATFDNKNVGMVKTVSISGISISGTDAGNYIANTSTTTTADITAKALTITATGISKTYDGNTIAAVTLSDNRVSGDVLTTTNATAIFDNKNVGSNKTVSVSGISISGTDAGNYIANTTTITTADITARTLTITATGANKIYDGNTTAAVTLGDDRVSGDIFATTYTTATFDDKNVGTGKIISVNGISISGTDAGNYTANTSTSTTAAITAKALTIKADNKEKYEGESNPALTISYDGFISTENNSVLTVQPEIGTVATTSSLRGTYSITTSGASAQNYNISYVSGVLTVKAEAPTNMSLNPTILYENLQAGTVTGALSSASDSPVASFTYTLVSGSGDTDNNRFSINGGQLQTVAPLDYEAQKAYSIRIRSTTQYGLSIEKTFTIQLSDVNEAPTLDAIANQEICYTEVTQEVSLTGITAGPDAGQSTTTSVSTTNNSLFESIEVTQANSNGNATIKYKLAQGVFGSAVINVMVVDNGGTANGGVSTILKSFTLQVNQLPAIGLTSEKGNELSKGEVTVLKSNITGGNSGLTYSWANANGIQSGQNLQNLTVRPSETTTYKLTVTNSNGCSSVQEITITVNADYKVVEGTNIVTPNGDGINDRLVIRNLDMYPKNEVKIYDRAGRLLYSQKNYTDQWDGTLNGAQLAEDTYYYIVDFGPGIERIKGFITIVKE